MQASTRKPSRGFDSWRPRRQARQPTHPAPLPPDSPHSDTPFPSLPMCSTHSSPVLFPRRYVKRVRVHRRIMLPQVPAPLTRSNWPWWVRARAPAQAPFISRRVSACRSPPTALIGCLMWCPARARVRDGIGSCASGCGWRDAAMARCHWVAAPWSITRLRRATARSVWLEFTFPFTRACVDVHARALTASPRWGFLDPGFHQRPD